MFDNLSARLEGVVTKLKRKGRLSAADIEAALKEIRGALLEADVNLTVVRQFTQNIHDAAIGTTVSRALTPAQQIIKLVDEELRSTLGGESFRLTFASTPPTVIMLVGLQGSGKTTAAGKLALWLRRQGRHPMLVGADLARPAAVEQLRILAETAQVDFYSEPTDPVSVAREGLARARSLGRDVVIIDTAGRLAVDAELMEEMRRIEAAAKPNYNFLVIDAMIGQDALGTAGAFSEAVGLSGTILTKLDGDARGGAALSVVAVTGKKIAFSSVGEKLEDFDTFHPDRMANRILGMGDVLTLIEKAERQMDKNVAEKGAQKLAQGKFDLEDFLEQMQQVKKMGPLKGIMSMLPGVPKELRDVDIDERELARTEAIISSMTRDERRNPVIIDASRRQRIAAGSGSTSMAVSNLLKQFKDMQKMMRQMGVGPASATKRPASARAAKKKGKRR
ncbi:MAG: signal recognition particle protein [Actinomycetota bacterium]|nr:signal recognition particle protein [Actinomycetota bacterium]